MIFKEQKEEEEEGEKLMSRSGALPSPPNLLVEFDCLMVLIDADDAFPSLSPAPTKYSSVLVLLPVDVVVDDHDEHEDAYHNAKCKNPLGGPPALALGGVRGLPVAGIHGRGKGSDRGRC
jgi:hypothetical protein